jgi:hypothetical protein
LRGKVKPKFGLLLSFPKKTAHRKPLPNWRKFAQSGHPAFDPHIPTYLCM